MDNRTPAHRPMITPETFAASARALQRDLDLITCPAPDSSRRVAPMGEADWDTVGLTIAQLMKACAEYLEDAGFETEAAMAVAEKAEAEFTRLAKERIQICPGCGVMPGEGMDEDCTGDLGCDGGEPNQ